MSRSHNEKHGCQCCKPWKHGWKDPLSAKDFKAEESAQEQLEQKEPDPLDPTNYCVECGSIECMFGECSNERLNALLLEDLDRERELQMDAALREMQREEDEVAQRAKERFENNRTARLYSRD